MNPEQTLGKSQRQERCEGLSSQAPNQGERVRKLTRPIPVARQLPGNRLDPSYKRRLAWAVTGQVGTDWS